MISDRPICVAGAGSIGCFVGGMYAAAGRSVALLARPRVIAEIEGHGLRLTGFDGFERRIEADRLTLSEHAPVLGDAGAVLVAVKSADTAAIAERHGLQVPLSRRVLALVRAAEAAGNGAPRLTPEQIRFPSAVQIRQTS
jgi:2-dehydropantoate 2-reductase